MSISHKISRFSTQHHTQHFKKNIRNNYLGLTAMIISFRPTAEVGAHAFVVDHHVHAAIVAVAEGRLALAVQYLVYKLSSI